MSKKEIIDFKNGIEFSKDKYEAFGIRRNLTDPDFYYRFSSELVDKYSNLSDLEKKRLNSKLKSSDYIQKVVNIWNNGSLDSKVGDIPSLMGVAKGNEKIECDELKGNIPPGGIAAERKNVQEKACPVKAADKNVGKKTGKKAGKVEPKKGKTKSKSSKAVTRASAVARLKRMNLLKGTGGPLKGKRREKRIARIEELLKQKFKKVGGKYKEI